MFKRIVSHRIPRAIRGWRVAATIIATAAVYVGQRAYVAHDDELTAEDTASPNRRRINTRQRSNSVSIPFFRFLIVPAVLLIVAIGALAVTVVQSYHEFLKQEFPSLQDLCSRAFLWIIFAQELMLILPFFIHCKMLRHFRHVVLQIEASSMLLGVHFIALPWVAMIVLGVMLGFGYEYRCGEIQLHELRFYLFVGTVDLLLMCFSQLLYRLIKGDPGLKCWGWQLNLSLILAIGHFFALEQQAYIRQISTFQPPSPFVLRWSTMLFNFCLPSTTYCQVQHNSKSRRVLFVANSSLLSIGLPMLIRRCYEKTGIYPRVLLDRLWFSIPFLGNIITLLGGVKVTSSCCEVLIEAGESVLIFPGDDKERWQATTSAYSLDWPDTSVYSDIFQLAIECDYQIVPLATLGVSDNFRVLGNITLPQWMFKAENIQLPVLFPVAPWNWQRIYYSIGECINPPSVRKSQDDNDYAVIQTTVAELVKRVKELDTLRNEDPYRYRFFRQAVSTHES